MIESQRHQIRPQYQSYSARQYSPRPTPVRAIAAGVALLVWLSAVALLALVIA
jgi:hypothetical protein